MMRSATLRSTLGVIMVLALTSACFAAANKTISVSANVPSVSGGFNVNVSRIRGSDNVWELTDPNLPIDFRTLTYDNTWGIFRSQYYYAVDVGVTDNSGADWMVTHNRSSVVRDALNNLDNNINVSFLKQLPNSDISLQKVSYANSNNIGYTKSQLSGGWLRIYYGIATGQNDASGVVPIDANKPTGLYSGSVVLTLTP